MNGFGCKGCTFWLRDFLNKTTLAGIGDAGFQTKPYTIVSKHVCVITRRAVSWALGLQSMVLCPKPEV